MVHGRIGNGNCSCGSRHDSQGGSSTGYPAAAEARIKAIKEAKRRKEAREKAWLVNGGVGPGQIRLLRT